MKICINDYSFPSLEGNFVSFRCLIRDAYCFIGNLVAVIGCSD